MILIAIGSNLSHPKFGDSRTICERALVAICQASDGQIIRRSGWYRTRPVPDIGQPWYVNGVVHLASELRPDALLLALHRVERDFGRVRTAPAADRTLDIDLLDHNGEISAPFSWPILPHPRLIMRAFVLVPLATCAPEWRHPITGCDAQVLLALLADRGSVEPLA